jgi:hypothetical protein
MTLLSPNSSQQCSRSNTVVVVVVTSRCLAFRRPTVRSVVREASTLLRITVDFRDRLAGYQATQLSLTNNKCALVYQAENRGNDGTDTGLDDKTRSMQNENENSQKQSGQDVFFHEQIIIFKIMYRATSTQKVQLNEEIQCYSLKSCRLLS